MNGHEWLLPVLRLRSEMQPQPTDVEASVRSLAGIRAVIFDVYGTLVISGSGDVGSADTRDHSDLIEQSLKAVGIADALGNNQPRR